MDNYFNKYKKFKYKYLKLSNQLGGRDTSNETPETLESRPYHIRGELSLLRIDINNDLDIVCRFPQNTNIGQFYDAVKEKINEALEEIDTPCRFEVRPSHGDLTNQRSISYINERINTLSEDLSYDKYINGPPRPLKLFPYYFKSRVSFIRYSEDGLQNEVLEIFTPEMFSDIVKEKIDSYIKSEFETEYQAHSFRVESSAGTLAEDNVKNQRGLSTINDEITKLFEKRSEQWHDEGRLSEWPYNIKCTIDLFKQPYDTGQVGILIRSYDPNTKVSTVIKEIEEIIDEDVRSSMEEEEHPNTFRVEQSSNTHLQDSSPEGISMINERIEEMD